LIQTSAWIVVLAQASARAKQSWLVNSVVFPKER